MPAQAVTAANLLQAVVDVLNSTLEFTAAACEQVPGSAILWRYVQRSYQNDPFRVGLELLLLCFGIAYLFHRKTHPDEGTMVKLSDKEIEELVDEWQPEPLVPALTEAERLELETLPVVAGPPGAKLRIKDGRVAVNLASYNFLGLVANETIKAKAVAALRRYGVGSCGPPGFYGTLDVHRDLEKQIAELLGTEEAIIYAQSFSTVSSVIPAFAKRGDIIVCDDGVNFAVQKGIQISRSVIRWFKHNDMADLERILEEVHREAAKKNSPLTRRFIVAEGLYQNFGDIAPLPKIIELKKKYKYRLILDESLSFGTLGPRGAGLTDHFKVPVSDVEFVVGSLAHALCSSGGFCAGSHQICDHQRLSGLSYCFSASLPALLAVAASEGLNHIRDGEKVRKSGESVCLRDLRENGAAILHILSNVRDMETTGAPGSPVVHLRLRSGVVPERESAAVEDGPFVSKQASKRKSVEAKRQEEERILQDIVDVCAKDGVLVTRAKYFWAQEVNPPAPSIRICATSALTKRETEKAANVIKNACARVLARRR